MQYVSCVKIVCKNFVVYLGYFEPKTKMISRECFVYYEGPVEIASLAPVESNATHSTLLKLKDQN